MQKDRSNVPIVFGVTGNMASGKTTVAQWMGQSRGWPVFDADAAVRELYQDPDVHRRLREIFPRMPEDLEYAHPWIRGEVRRDPRYLDLLEGCFHPLVREVCEVFMASHCRAEAVIWDIPLLYEAGWEADCDAVIVVVAPLEERLRRLGAERWTEEDKRWWHHIQGRQWPPERTIPLANYVLENAVSVEASTEALNRWITEYTKRRHDA